MRIDVNRILAEADPPPDWLIENTIHAGSQVVLAATAGTGKSMFCVTLACALAVGADLIGKCDAKRVLYIDEENNESDLVQYGRWGWRATNSQAPNLLRENLRIESMSLGAAPDWSGALYTLANEHKPSLIVIDTATPACRIKDENNNSEASAASHSIRVAQSIAAPGCAALVLKHLRFDQNGKVDIRGAKAWAGACDGIWYHMVKRGRPRTSGWRSTYIKPEKVRAFGLRQQLEITPIMAGNKFERFRIERFDCDDD